MATGPARAATSCSFPSTMSEVLAARLEPFLLMAKSVKGAGAAKLVQDATAAPGVFVFGELLELPSVSEVCTRGCAGART